MAVATLALLGAFALLPPDEIAGLEVATAQTGPSASPAPRQYHFMAYDTESGRSILFGGEGARPTVLFGDTWAYDGGAGVWTEMNPATGPRARSGHSMAYDAESDRVILFSGGRGLSALRDTWAYDFNTDTWQDMAPDGGPPEAFGARMAYDPRSDRVILFGGVRFVGTELVASNETWAYDANANTWAMRNPSSSPSPRAYHAMAYDADSDRVVLFGGDQSLAANDESDETWAYDYENDTWQLMSPPSSPAVRYYHALVYDERNDLAVFFGGQSLGADTNETWAYDYDTDTWADRQPTASPPPRKRHAMTYDSAAARIVLHGGLGTELYGDTWTYDYGTNSWADVTPATVPTEPQNLQAFPQDIRVNLTWDPPASDGGSAITAYRVYRGTTPGELPLLVAVDRLTFSDTAVSPGITYYYQVSAVNDAGEGQPSSPVTAHLPDREPPTITITSPANGVTVSNISVTIMGVASDNVALEKVEVSTGGASWALTTGKTSWSISVMLEVGENLIHARATDTSGLSTTENITVFLPPAPGGNRFVCGPVCVVTVFAAAGAVIAVVVTGLWLRSRR